MFSKILVALDGSTEAEVGLPFALELAKRFDAAIVLLEVTPEPHIVAATVAESFGASGSVAAQDETAVAAESAATAYLDAVRERYGNAAWQLVVAGGKAADAIVTYAEEAEIDLIVIATQGRSGLKRLFIGSVADDVIRNGHTPVLVVHANASAR